MKTRVQVAPLLLLLILIAAAGYTGAAWWIGMASERRLQQNEGQLLNNASYLELVSRNYRRGIFSSTEDVTYGLGGSIAQYLRMSGAAAALSSIHLTVHHTIEHGPLPGFRPTLALATIDSQLQLPPAMQQAVETILNGQPLLHTHTILKWSGDSESTLDSPAFKYQLPDGTRIAWYGIDGKGHATADLKHWSGEVGAPGLTVEGPMGKVELHGLNFGGDMQRALDTFYIGHSEAGLDSVTGKTLNGSITFSMRGLSLQSDANLNGDYLEQHASLSAERLEVPQFSLTRLGYVLSLSHLHAQTLAALVTAMRDPQRDLSGAPTPARLSGTQMTVFSRYGLALAAHGPLLNIERIGFVAPEGEFRLSAKLSVPGLSQQDLQGSAAIAVLMMHLDLTAELRIDAPLLDKLLAVSGKRELVTGQLAQLERQGYLRRDGNALTSELVLQSGSLKINGLPYRPKGATTP